MIESGYFWTVVLILAAGTFSIRSSVVLLSHRIQITARHREIFSYIPAAIIPALTLPMVFFHQGQVGLLLGKERLLVLILASIVCYLTRNMLITVVFGLALLFALTQY